MCGAILCILNKKTEKLDKFDKCYGHGANVLVDVYQDFQHAMDAIVRYDILARTKMHGNM